MKKFVDKLDEWIQEQNLKNQKYYHGTSSALGITHEIKPPIFTNKQREESRKYNQDVVYVTSSIGAAQRWAVKAVKKFGGHPFVYEVEPDFLTLNHRINDEYTTKYATVKNILQF